MSHEQAVAERPSVPPGPGDPTDEDIGDAFSAAFNGEPTSGMDPYVRLVPPAGESRAQVFDPHDIERREYRLLARALTNDDDLTKHLAAMTLVQLVKFLRAARASVSRGSRRRRTLPTPGRMTCRADIVHEAGILTFGVLAAVIAALPAAVALPAIAQDASPIPGRESPAGAPRRLELRSNKEVRHVPDLRLHGRPQGHG